MGNKTIRLLAAALLAMLALVGPPANSSAEPAGPEAYAIPWWTVDGGGSGCAASTGGAFSLRGAVGQPDAGSYSGGQFTINGGYWHQSGPQVQCPWLHLPLVRR